MPTPDIETTETIQSRLAAWDDLAQQPQPASQRSSNWLKYSAAIGSAMALATSAEAGIIYTAGPVATTAQTHGVPGHATASVNSGLNGGAFQIFDGIGAPDPYNAGGGDGFASLKNTTNIKFATLGIYSTQAQKFAAGAMIGAGDLFNNRALLGINQTANNIGAFNSHYGGDFTTTGYAGLQITSGANTYYGWVELSVKQQGEIDQVTALGWAYDNVAGESIAAGAGGPGAATPEPASAGLALLALGSAGVLAWRRRKNTAQTA